MAADRWMQEKAKGLSEYVHELVRPTVVALLLRAMEEQRERDAEIAEVEQLKDPVGAGDAHFNQGCRFCAAAIRRGGE